MADENTKLKDWKVGQTYLHTTEVPSFGWIINSDCNQCKAFEGAKLASLKNIKKEAKSGGKNPGSLICASFEKTEIFLALDKAGNQMTFCRFPDQSFISNESLLRAAIANDH
jgi:hypothetical protein